MILIGISGKKGVGKNYISEKYIVPYFIKKYNELFPSKIISPYFISFGTCVKAELYGRKTELDFEKLMINEKTKLLRKQLQEYGTDIGRGGYGKDIWIRQVDFWMKNHIYSLECSGMTDLYVPLFVIQDIRFENELEFIQNFPNALIIRVISEKRNSKRCLRESNKIKDEHISETSLLNVSFPYYIYNEDQDDEDVFVQSKTIVDDFINQSICSVSSPTTTDS